MDRGMTGAMIVALSEREVRACHLLWFFAGTQSLWMTDAAVDLSWDGHTWVRNHLLGFSDITESMDLELPRATVTFSGVDQSGIAIILQNEFLNRPAKIYKALLTESLSVIADPLLLFYGRMDAPKIAVDPEAGACTVSIDIVARFTPLGRARARYTNHASQQIVFPGDKGFEHVTDETTTLVWGGAGHRSTAIRGGGGSPRWNGRSSRSRNSGFGGG